MQLSSSQLETVRSRPQSTRLYLSIFQPRAVFKARINNASIARGARSIAYDTVTLGAYTDIRAGHTMWIGTSEGAKDVGKIRVRSATSGVITVSENSNIDWADNLYLTIFHYFELWPVFPRIILNPADEGDSIFYKDYDIPYSNQNSLLGTYVNIGPHRAALLDPASGLAQLYWSSTGTHNLLGNSLNYNWTFEGGSPVSSTSADPGYVSYNTPGHYVTRLTVSGSNGAMDTTYRYVSIYNDANPPVQKWELLSLGGSRDEGGYTASFKVFENVSIEDGSVVVLFQDSFYGSTRQNIGGNYPNGSNIFWVGYVDKDSIAYDYEHSEVSFSAHSITLAMKKSSGFSVSVESKASPAKWYELLDMDGRRALYHYLRWHTTALQIADFQFVGNDPKIQFFDADRESMYDALDNYMRDTLLGQVVADRQGKVWMEVEAMAYFNPTGAFPPVMTITNRDWMNEPSIEERLADEMSFIEMGGIAYNGVASGTFSAILASAPGNAPGFRGTVETHEGLALVSQALLNQTAGNVFANKNSPFPSIEMELGINTSNLDIAPQETAQITVLASDTVRNLAVSSPYIPNRMDWGYTPDDFILLPKIQWRQLVSGIAGESVSVSAPDDVGPGFHVPGIEIPEIPPLVIPGFNSTGTSCCDELARVYDSQCCTVIKYSHHVTNGGSPPVLVHNVTNYEYRTNPSMYDPNYTDGSNILGIGASGTYSIHLEFDYVNNSTFVLGSGLCGRIQILGNTSATSTGVLYDLYVTDLGGHVSLDGTASLPGGAGDSGFFCRATAVSPSFVLVDYTLSNVKVMICKTG